MEMQDIELLSARLNNNKNLYSHLQSILCWFFKKQSLKDIPTHEAFLLFAPFMEKGFAFFSALETFTVTSRPELLAQGAAKKGALSKTQLPFLRYATYPWERGKTSFVPQGDSSLLFLGWDSGVALERNAGNYIFTSHVKTGTTRAPSEEKLFLINEDGTSSGYELFIGSGFKQLMTVNVSSCSVCLFMDDNMEHLFFTHLDADSLSPFSLLKASAGWTQPLTTMVVSMVHDFKELQRILGFAMELGVKRIEILDRGAPSFNGDDFANVHLYTGLFTVGETPHMFISFGSIQQLIQCAELNALSIPNSTMQPALFFNTLQQLLGYPINQQKLYNAICDVHTLKPSIERPADKTPATLMKFLCQNKAYFDCDPALLEVFSPFFLSYYTPALRADGHML